MFAKSLMITNYRTRMYECKVHTMRSTKNTKSSQYFKYKRYAAILLIQRSFKAWKLYAEFNSLTMPSLEMIANSQYLKRKWKAEALVKGWKTRKILNSESIKNHRTQVLESKLYYTRDNDRNKYFVQAKNSYIQAVNAAFQKTNWWRDLVKSKTLQEKRERVQKMREKTQRIRNNKAITSNKAHVYHNTSYHTDYKSNTSIDSSFNGGLSMAFDFSKTAKSKKKAYQDLEYEKRSKKVDQNRQKKKKEFLKRRSNLKYDPIKAVEEDNYKRQFLESQHDITSDLLNDEDSILEDKGSKVSAAKINLGALIEKEKQRKIK